MTAIIGNQNPKVGETNFYEISIFSSLIQVASMNGIFSKNRKTGIGLTSQKTEFLKQETKSIIHFSNL